MPVVSREMLVQSRHKTTYRTRSLAALIGLGVMVWLLLVSASNMSAADQGKSIFNTIAWLAAWFAFLGGAAFTSDSLSAEKREGTLGLLFLTDLRPRALVLGKVAASSLLAITGLMSVLPVLALGFLLGGISWHAMARMAVVLLNTLLLSLAVGAFVSARSVNERRSMMGTIVIMLIVLLWPFLSGFVFGTFDHPAVVPEIFCASPAYSFHAAGSNVPKLAPYFWEGLAFQHLLAWVFLWMAGSGLKDSLNPAKSRWTERFDRFEAEFLFGKGEQRWKHRARLLDRNAFLWLGARERVKPRYAWGIVLFFVAMWLTVWFFYGEMAVDLPLLVGVMMLAHFVFKLWTCSEVCNRFIQDRRAGALELLLTTPLDVPDIAHGISLALRHIFRKPIVALIVFELFLMGMAILAPRQLADRSLIILWFAGLIGTLLVDLWALKWLALWSSLYAASIGRVLIVTILKIMLVPVALFVAIGGGLAWYFKFSRGIEIESSSFVQLWLVLNLPYVMVIGAAARSNFLKHFRESAAVPPGSAPAAARPDNLGLWLRDLLGPSSRVLRSLRWLPAPLRHRWKTTAALALLAILAAACLVRATYWQARVDRALQAISARKEPATLLDIDRYYPAPPLTADAAETLRQVRPRLSSAIRRLAGSTNEWTGEDMDLAEATVRSNRTALAVFHESARRETMYLPPSVPNQVPARGWFDYEPFMALGRLELQLALHHQDVAAALQSIRCQLAHVRLTRSVAFFPAQAWCLNHLRSLLPALEQSFSRLPLTEEALAGIDRLLIAADNPEALARSAALMRCLIDYELENSQTNPWMPMPVQRFAATAEGFRRWTGSKARNRAEYLEQASQAIEAARLPYASRREAASPFWEGLSRVQLPAWSMNSGSGEAMSSLFYHDALTEASLVVARTAVALQRYRLRHGKLPEQLALLVPDFLPALPEDPFANDAIRVVRGIAGPMIRTATGLRYLRTGSGAVVYSVGPGGEDNQGARGNPGNANDISVRLPQ